MLRTAQCLRYLGSRVFSFRGLSPFSEALRRMDGRGIGAAVKEADPLRMEDAQAHKDCCYVAFLPHTAPPEGRTGLGDKVGTCNCCRV